MVVLANSVDMTAAPGDSIISLMKEPGSRNLLKVWKLQVKNITVIQRFSRKYRAKSFQCGIAQGLTAVSPQLIPQVKKSNSSEGSKTKNLSKGALFSPNPPVQDAPKRKFKLRTSENRIGEGFSFKIGDFFKDHRALSPIQILLTLISFQILKETDLLDEALVIVTVIALDARQEGTTATYNHVVRPVLRGPILLVLCSSTFGKSGVNALDDSKDGKLECPNEQVDLPYNVEASAWTFVAGIFLIAEFVRRINRRPLVSEIPAAAAPAMPPIVLAPPAVPAPAIPPIVLAPPAVPAPAIPIGFVNVMDVLADNPDAARRSGLEFHIHSSLD